MNNLLSELLNRQTNPYQIHYYENINIYPENNSRASRTTRTPQVNTRTPQVNTRTPQVNTRAQTTSRRNVRSRNNLSATPQNEHSYVETIEIEPIITSVTFNPLESNMNSVFNQLTNSFLNLSQNRNQGVSMLNLNSKTELLTATDTDTGENCSICSSNYTTNQIIRKITGCSHKFHQECVDRWFATNSTCPICRINLNTPLEQNRRPSQRNNSPEENNSRNLDQPNI
jgi:hypothetical protein